MKNTIILVLGLLIYLFVPDANILAGQSIDNSIYAGLLEKHVDPGGRVNYTGFKKDEAVLDNYLAILNAADIDNLSKKEQFAFYINTYNAFTIKLVLSKYPGINSIKEIGSFFTNPWQIKFIQLQNKKVTLDFIEHDVLRPRFKDPRVHFAINCASKSCPPLRKEPYEAQTLDDQLDEQARMFINNPRRNFIKDNTLFLSKIFKWFKEDFNDNPIPFVRRFAEPPLKEMLKNAGADIQIKYLSYDWSLNQ